MENKVNNLISHLTFLEEANIEKEGQINYLKGVVDLMSDKLCQYRIRETSVEMTVEELLAKEEEGSQLEYAKDDEHHTPEVGNLPLLVCELQLTESPLLDQLADFFDSEECC